MGKVFQFTVGGTEFCLSKEDVELRLAGSAPEPIRELYVEVRGTRYPVKQALAVAADMSRGAFTSHDAMRVFRKLALPVGTESAPPAASSPTGNCPRITAEADLTGWLRQLMSDLDGVLADFTHALNAIDNGTYKKGVSGQRFGLVEVGFDNAAHLEPTAKERAGNACLMGAIGKFISFLDKLIASAIIQREGITIDRNLNGDDQITAYLNDYMAHKITAVATDRSITNPKKLSYFAIPEPARQTGLGYFALRRAIEHHQGIATEGITIHTLKQKIFIDDNEVTALPAYVADGQTVQLRLVPETKSYPAGTRITLAPEDVHAIVSTIRMSLGPQIFEAHIKAGQPRTEKARSS